MKMAKFFVRGTSAGLILGILVGWMNAVVAQQASAPDVREPVLVELFTSEGCSDCPPADALLARLDTTQFVSGAHAIVLSEHVTYWNHLGWRDPFSLDEATARQESYVEHFGLSSSYTPQMVVDGAAQFVGSDSRALSLAVARAASTPKKSLVIEGARWESGSVQFSVRGAADHGARVMAALAADATHVEVSRGENAGRTLHHVAVVQVIKEFDGSVLDGRALHIASPGPNGDKQDSPIRLVVFVVDRKMGHVLAATEETLRR
jgi:hypothetical protein